MKEVEKYTRLMTYQELSDWLRECPEEHREFRYVDGNKVYTEHPYYDDYANEPVINVKIRQNHGKWQEPFFE